MRNKLLSILIPLYNKEKYIIKSIKSLITQEYQNIEILIYDDFSTDNSLLELNNLFDNRIKIFKGVRNMGVKYARDFLLTKAKGYYISFFDADDLCCYNKYTESIKYLNENSKIDIIGSKVNYINESDNYIYKPFTFESFSSSEIKTNLFFCNTITTSTIVFKQEISKDINFQKFNYVIGEDYYMWVKLAEKYNFVNLKKKLTIYRITNNGMMANTTDKYAEAITNIHNYQFEKFGIINRPDLVIIHNKFMYSDKISKVYLIKSVFLYKFLLYKNNNYFDNKALINQIRVNWLRKLIIFSKTSPVKSFIYYFKYFPYHNIQTISKVYILLIFILKNILSLNEKK
jgi:glycosyltransferase involved in cell wall biosynthesis